jgi:O-antigen/teichoic acid export membrane protein
MLLLFSTPYLSATSSFVVLLFTLLTTFPGIFMGNAVFAHNAQKSFVWFLALGAVSNGILDYVLIPRWGILGCAIATLAAQCLAQGFSFLRLRKIQHFEILPHLKKIVTANIVMGGFIVAARFANMPTAVIMILAALLYGITLFALKEPLIKDFLPRRLLTRAEEASGKT